MKLDMHRFSKILTEHTLLRKVEHLKSPILFWMIFLLIMFFTDSGIVRRRKFA